MDFELDETQTALRELARRIFSAHATHDRLKELEAGGESFDAELWASLDSAGLLGVGVDEGGFLEQCVVLVEQGRAVAPVPLWSHLVGNTFARRDGIVTVAVDEAGADDAYALRMTGDDGLLRGEKTGVPALDVAGHVVVSARGTDGPGVFVAPTSGLRGDRFDTTARFPEFNVAFDATEAELVSADVAGFAQRAVVAVCAIGVGVAERALEMTAAYTSERKQFERPLGSFQAVQQRAADAFIDVEAMRVAMWQAAWRISEGLDADHAVRVAKFWAAEAGQRVLASAQHLHGGMGADVDYPLHRYTLWSKWVELSFGGASPTLARMGEALAR